MIGNNIKAVAATAAVALALQFHPCCVFADEVDLQSSAAAQENTPPDPAIEAAIDKRQAEVNEAVARLLIDGADVKAILQELVGRFPSEFRDGVVRRIHRRLEEIREERNVAAERKRRWQSNVIIDGEPFNMSAAVLLMNTGAYESISALFSNDPNVAAETTAIGAFLLKSGVKPDTNMVRRLKAIYDAAVERQRQKERQSSGTAQ